MSRFDELLTMAKEEHISKKMQLLIYLARAVDELKKQETLFPEDITAIRQYAYAELDTFAEALAGAESFKQKDQIFQCVDALAELMARVSDNPKDVPKEQAEKLVALIGQGVKTRHIEFDLERLFKQETIEEAPMRELLEKIRPLTDEYHRGRLYAVLVTNKKSLEKLSDEAAAAVTEFITEDVKRMLSLEDPDEDCFNNLELAADLCMIFADDALLVLLQDMLKLDKNNIRYYAVASLLFHEQEVPAAVIAALAGDLEYANLTYSVLKQHGKQALFPATLANEEYLAKSDLVRWLVFPTELGKLPDQIEYLGKIKYFFKKEVYHVFKYRSDSDTLDEESKNKWLIGWSSEEGGTFSNFDRYAYYHKRTKAATLRNIKRKLIGR